MSDTQIVPVDKFDHAAVDRARALGHPALAQYYPELLEWVQDANWPVARPVAALLATAGPEIAPPILDILRTNDDFWQQWVLDLIIRHLDEDVWVLLKPDIDRLVWDGETEDVRDLAREIRASRL